MYRVSRVSMGKCIPKIPKVWGDTKHHNNPGPTVKSQEKPHHCFPFWAAPMWRRGTSVKGFQWVVVKHLRGLEALKPSCLLKFLECSSCLGFKTGPPGRFVGVQVFLPTGVWNSAPTGTHIYIQRVYIDACH